MSMRDDTFEREYEREMFRSAVFSSLWAMIADRKRKGFKLGDLAVRLGKDKGYVSRLFSRHENCKLNTIADLAHAAGADIRFEVIDRETGVRYGPSGALRKAPTHVHVVRQDFVMGEFAQETRFEAITRRVR